MSCFTVRENPGQYMGGSPLRASGRRVGSGSTTRTGPGQLLKEAGYEDGFDIDISTAATRGTSVSKAACEAMAVMLQDVGINAIVKNVPTSILYPGYKERTQSGITCQGIGQPRRGTPLATPLLL